mmetsp:Transcript_21345/g.52550  ORF Transcript_21345/g.52550 Transcript_21345/m.52550 type:complete len:452 (-) Transcript_21345:8-1363(-)
MPRRARAVPRGRHSPPLPLARHRPRDRRLRPLLLLRHLRPHLHRRRQRHGLPRGAAAAGPRVRAVPPHGDLRRGLPHHGRLPRRGRHAAQLRRRAVHGALRAVREGPRVARRRVAFDDHGDPRGPRRRPRKRPHLPPPRPPPAGSSRGAPAGDHRDREDLRGRRRHEGADPRAADGALQHGRDPDELARRGHHARERQGPRHSGATRRGRGRVRVRARREPARRQLAARHRRLWPRVRKDRRGGVQARRPAQGAAGRRGARVAREPRPLPQRRRPDVHRGDPHGHEEDHAARRGGVPHGGIPRGGRRENRRVLRQARRHRHPRPLPRVELGPRRGARAPEHDGQRRADHAFRRGPHGVPRRALARGLYRARRQELDEAHADVDRRLRGEAQEEPREGGHGLQARRVGYAGSEGADDDPAGKAGVLGNEASRLRGTAGWVITVSDNKGGSFL